MAFLYLEHNRFNGLNRTIMLLLFFFFLFFFSMLPELKFKLYVYCQTYKKLNQVKSISFTSHSNPVVSLVR